MLRLLIYFILLSLALFSLYRFLRSNSLQTPLPANKARKRIAKENWVQVYETASWEEAQQIQDRLQEEKVECILYEQGKKDIHGKSLRGIGIAVPKPSVVFAQKIISRIPV